MRPFERRKFAQQRDAGAKVVNELGAKTCNHVLTIDVSLKAAECAAQLIWAAGAERKKHIARVRGDGGQNACLCLGHEYGGSKKIA